MRHRLAVAIGVGVALVAAGFLASFYVGGRRGPSGEAPEPALSRPIPVVGVSRRTAEDSAARSRNVVSLREMSPSFRHSTFLIAIRQAGYYCDDVVAAEETGDGIWITNCTDTRRYQLSARLTDALSVEAIYYDANPRSLRSPLIDQLPLDREPPVERSRQWR